MNIMKKQWCKYENTLSKQPLDFQSQMVTWNFTIHKMCKNKTSPLL